LAVRTETTPRQAMTEGFLTHRLLESVSEQIGQILMCVMHAGRKGGTAL